MFWLEMSRIQCPQVFDSPPHKANQGWAENKVLMNVQRLSIESSYWFDIQIRHTPMTLIVNNLLMVGEENAQNMLKYVDHFC